VQATMEAETAEHTLLYVGASCFLYAIVAETGAKVTLYNLSGSCLRWLLGRLVTLQRAFPAGWFPHWRRPVGAHTGFSATRRAIHRSLWFCHMGREVSLDELALCQVGRRLYPYAKLGLW
jgi:hypothetical protein